MGKILRKRRNPYLAVDAVILNEDHEVVLIKRKHKPFKDRFALPGGFVEWGETVEEACKREVREETGLNVEITDLVGVFSDPKRDPRGHICSVVFIAKKVEGTLEAATDASVTMWVPLAKIKADETSLAFDHKKIIEKTIQNGYSLR